MEQPPSVTAEAPLTTERLRSFEYNFAGSYNIKEVTSTFYELKNIDKYIDKSRDQPVIYAPQGQGLY